MHVSIAELARLLCYFDAELTVSQAERLSSVVRDTISRLWDRFRHRIQMYMQANPVKFGPSDIVEIDESYLKPLLPNGDETTQQVVLSVALLEVAGVSPWTSAKVTK